jgi:hypothetical protein
MAAGVVLCAVAFVVLWMLLRMLPTSSAVGGPKTLDVLWHKFYGTASEEWIVGEVENRSNRTLTGVLACGEYYAGDGRTIETAIRPLDQAVLLPGQKSHFKIVAPYESEIEQSWFHFQTMDGEQLSFRR